MRLRPAAERLHYRGGVLPVTTDDRYVEDGDRYIGRIPASQLELAAHRREPVVERADVGRQVASVG